MRRSPLSAVRNTSLRRWSGGSTRSTWVAPVVGVVVVVLIAGGVLGPVLGLIAAADGATGTALDVPVGRIVLGLLVALVLVAVLLVAAGRCRGPVARWTLACLAAVVALVASLYPLLAVAFSAVDQARDVIPFIRELVARFGG